MSRLRPRWLDVVLVLCLALLGGFLVFHDRISSTSPWLSIWPNIITDLFAIWLGVRIIDNIISEQQRKRAAALSLRGGLNYTMQLAHDLLPRPGWPLWRLRDEIRWLRLRLDLQSNLVRADERRFGEAAILRLEAITGLADRLKSLLRQVDVDEEDVRKVFERATKQNVSHLHRYDIGELGELERTYNDYAYDPEVDTGQLIVAIRSVRNVVQSGDLDPDVRSTMKVYLAAIEASVDARTELKEKIDEYISFVRDAEMTILSRHAVDDSA